EEEMLHWTTTLSRSGLSKRTVCASMTESHSSSPDSNSTFAKDSTCVNEDRRKEENYPGGSEQDVNFNSDQVLKGYISTALGKAKTVFKRTPMPGHRQVNKKASVESVKTVTESEVQESITGRYAHMKTASDVEAREGYSFVRHISSSNRPIPKPSKTVSAGVSKKDSHSSIRTSGVAEVLQIRNNRMEVTETVMHIYESQGCHDNYFANEDYNTDSASLHGSISTPEQKPFTVSGPCSYSNDCDIDIDPTESLQRHKEETLSLSSEPLIVKQETKKLLSLVDEKDAINESNMQKTLKNVKPSKGVRKKKSTNTSRNPKSSTLTGSLDKKQRKSAINTSKYSPHLSIDKLHRNVSLGKKSLSSIARSGQNSTGPGKPQIRKVSKDGKTPRKEQSLLANIGNVKRTPPQRENIHETAAKDNGHNVNTPTRRPQMKKNMSDILQPKASLSPGNKNTIKPKSMTDKRKLSPKKSSELSVSFSKPSLNPSPSEVHQYVEDWLEKVNPDPTLYTEVPLDDESRPQTKTVFHIGGDSESDIHLIQNNVDEHYPSSGDAAKESASCLSAPPCCSLVLNAQHAKGSSGSMPSVRVDPVYKENGLTMNSDNEISSSTSNIFRRKEKIKSVLQKLCSTIQHIRWESNTNAIPSLVQSNNLPDFPIQVASVFGSSCKAFLSFLSVMTLRDDLTGNKSRSTSEAMRIVEALQKISAIKDMKEQSASLADLQNTASSHFKERWMDFQILRQRLENEPIPSKFSETEIAQDVVSEDIFEDHLTVIDELMEELNMPQDLKTEILSTIRDAKCFYRADKSTFLNTECNLLDSDEEIGKSTGANDNKIKEFPELDTACTTENITQIKQGNDDDEQSKMMMESERVPDKFHEAGNDVTEISKRERYEQLKENKNEDERQVEVEEELVWVNDKEDEDIKEINNDGEETETGEVEWKEVSEEKAVTEEKMDDREGEEWEAEKGSKEDTETVEKVEEGREEKMTENGEELKIGETEEETQEGLLDDEDEETTQDDSFEEANVERTETNETEDDGFKADEENSEEEEEEGGKFELKKEVVEETNYVSDEERLAREEWEEEEGDDLEKKPEEHTKSKDEERITEFTVVKEEEEEVEHVEHVEQEKEEKKEIAAASEKDVEDAAHKEEDEWERAEVIEGDDKEDAEKKDGEEKGKTKAVCEENNGEAEENELEEVEDGGDVDVKNKTMNTDENEESKEQDSIENQAEEESTTDKQVLEEKHVEEMGGEHMLDREERENNESSELNKGFKRVQEQETKDEVEEESFSDNTDCIAGETDCEEEAQQSSVQEEANLETMLEHDSESPTKHSPENQYEDDKSDVTDTVDGPETDEGGGHHKEIFSSLQHQVEISQQLLDFVNSALQSSSLTFTYDAEGIVRLEPANPRVAPAKILQKEREDSSYGLKCLPSPNTSDLSDYRPETSESGGFKTRESVGIVTDSAEELSENPSLCWRHKTSKSDLSIASNLEFLQNSRTKSEGSVSSFDPAAEASGKDLSFSSSGSSQKTDAAAEAERGTFFTLDKDSTDGILIDQGRWLLKENHLIRKSPPVALGMYDPVDTSSLDTGQGDTSEESPCHSKTQLNPLAAISSSELEEKAKPQTPKCTYYNLPHGSDSDPFLDESSSKNGKKDTSIVKGKGFRVSPKTDTSKTWANKNGSLSSFASVEFKAPDRKVHPEGESSAVTQARRTSSGRGAELQAQDSLDPLRVRCCQYCPIL
ncbi:calponin homology domain-containing protein DDB_G0272472-like, partial [Brachionichthys hirsutus]|uniref:calponin homology domain-containing protein DDB_G0272472-like n=1 Tax=Brachionichthys hirsutus TaxID=412623 RepID=UPI003605257B